MPLIEVRKWLSGFPYSAGQRSHILHKLSLFSSKLKDFRVLTNGAFLRISKIGRSQRVPLPEHASSNPQETFLGDAWFEDDVGHYNYRRWTANEVNRTFPAIGLVLGRLHLHQDRPLLLQYLTTVHRELYQPGAQRVLGQSGDAVFENHYQSQFIGPALGALVDLNHKSLTKTYEVRSLTGCGQDAEGEECLVSPASNGEEEMASASELGAAKLALVLMWY